MEEQCLYIYRTLCWVARVALRGEQGGLQVGGPLPWPPEGARHWVRRRTYLQTYIDTSAAVRHLWSSSDHGSQRCHIRQPRARHARTGMDSELSLPTSFSPRVELARERGRRGPCTCGCEASTRERGTSERGMLVNVGRTGSDDGPGSSWLLGGACSRCQMPCGSGKEDDSGNTEWIDRQYVRTSSTLR